MALMTLSPWVVGQKLKAVTLNLMISAIQELQALATVKSFAGTKTGVVQTTGADTAVGTWATVGGFYVSGSGIAVPDAGVYAVTVRATKTSGAWSTRAYLSCTVASAIYKQAIDAGVGETDASLSFTTDPVGAGTVITPRYWTGTAATTTFILSIVKLPVA